MRRLVLIMALLAFFVCSDCYGSSPVDSAALLSLRALEAKADSGDSSARFRLARTLETGYGSLLPRDSLRARLLFERAAADGYAPAQNYLGFLLYKEERPDSALSWFMRAADQGDMTAYTNIGWMLLNGEGAVRDFDKALYWLREGVRRDSPAAAAMLADMYRTAAGVDADTIQARALYDRALELYAKGRYRDAGAINDVSKAIVSLYPAADSLATDSLMVLARKYMSLRAPAAGMAFVCKAADRGLPLAEALLGQAYARGRGMGYDPLASTVWFLRAAVHGDPSAQFIIAELLEMYPDILTETAADCGLTLDPDMHTAGYWLEKARAAGVDTVEKAHSPFVPYGL